MGLSSILDIIPSIITMGVVPLIFWIRNLMGKFDDISSQNKGLANGQEALRLQIKEMAEAQSREHGGVGELITKLEGEHNSHAIQAARQETKLDQVVRWVEKITPHQDK